MKLLNEILKFVSSHFTGCVFTAFGIWAILYSCFAKRLSFQGDVGLAPKYMKTYRATPSVRRRALIMSIPALAFGTFEVVLPVDRPRTPIRAVTYLAAKTVAVTPSSAPSPDRSTPRAAPE